MVIVGRLARHEQAELLEEDHGFELAGLTPAEQERVWKEEVEPWLAEAAPWDELPPSWRNHLSDFAGGVVLYEESEGEDLEALPELELVEGEIPGGDDTAKVCFKGDVGTLNAFIRDKELPFLVEDGVHAEGQADSDG